MAAQKGVALENNFLKGLITEATGLNFPEGACTETYDCEFELDGSVSRRHGFDFEASYATKEVNRTNQVVNTYLWRNVAGNGDVTVLANQIGNTVYFYRTSGSGNFSQGAIADTITLTPVAGAPVTETSEAQYSDGNGYLFITHPYCDPIRVSYDIDSDTVTSVNLQLKIRDFEGATLDSLAVNERPTTTYAAMSVQHKYNLFNQGWTLANLTLWDTAQTTMPSNADIMWRFKDATDNFDASTASIARVTAGNTPAPKGHYVLNLAYQDRNAASGLTALAITNTAFQRPSTSAFFAGRMFYSNINYVGFNSNIYFTQIIERPDQYEACYQVNDPTSEDLFDLLPSDGGVISIPEAGSIYKLFTVPGGMAVFAANGVWFVTGSTGLGFTANDYTVQKISNINTLSFTSFIDVGGFPCWWNSEGIYLMQGGQTLPSIQNLTYDKIHDFYTQIPLSSKRYARGFYHAISGNIRWIYKSVSTNGLTETYEFDRILNFSVRTGAFYPWTISDGDVKVNSIFSTEIITKPVSVLNVVDSLGNLVVDSHGDQVISFTASGSEDLQFDKYLVSYADDATYQMTFADRTVEQYRDWVTYDSLGKNYESFFVTGYKLQGQGMRKFQNNYVEIYARLDQPIKFHFQGIWDFAITGSGTGRWSAKQLLNFTNTDYSNDSRRLKVRGHGKVLQFKVSSIEGEPFDLIGWTALQTIQGDA